MKEEVAWRFLTFEALTNRELYAVLQLRSEVFVVEQACLFPDMDGLDPDAMHLLGMRQDALVAYARCFAPGLRGPEASLGRVLTHTSVRGSGLGHALVREAVARMAAQWGAQAIRIGAQAHLKDFYHQHGFVLAGLLYLEDGIPHLEMLRCAA